MNESDDVEILFVEDNVHEAKLTVRGLKKSNVSNKILHVNNGEKAMDFIFSRGKYIDRRIGGGLKLILLDLKLPKVDGLEILKAVKSDLKTRHIPVIVMTSSQEEQDVIRSYKFGANSYVVKPVNFEAFSKAVVDLGMYWMLLNVPAPLIDK